MQEKTNKYSVILRLTLTPWRKSYSILRVSKLSTGFISSCQYYHQNNIWVKCRYNNSSLSWCCILDKSYCYKSISTKMSRHVGQARFLYTSRIFFSSGIKSVSHPAFLYVQVQNTTIRGCIGQEGCYL